jgi:hypothetical protein
MRAPAQVGCPHHEEGKILSARVPYIDTWQHIELLVYRSKYLISISLLTVIGDLALCPKLPYRVGGNLLQVPLKSPMTYEHESIMRIDF